MEMRILLKSRQGYDLVLVGFKMASICAVRTGVGFGSCGLAANGRMPDIVRCGFTNLEYLSNLSTGTPRTFQTVVRAHLSRFVQSHCSKLVTPDLLLPNC